MQEASQSTLNPLNQTPLPGTNAGTITPSRPESFTPPSSSQNSWKRVRNDFLSTSAINNLEERNHVRTVEDKNKDKEIALARLNSTLQSGKLLGHQRTKLRQNFLAFALLLTVFIVTVLAGFGSVASREAQLQTAALLGESLIRNIRGDLSALKYYSEREIITLAIDFPNFYTLSNNITAIQGTKQMFAQLDSSEGIGVSSPLWGLYFANEDGLVVGVSRALKAGTTNTSMYECWGGNNGNTVRRTNASAVRCEASDLRHGQTNRGFRQYKYDARQRPWYKLAKSFPNQLVWTTPYVFSSTGYVGLTVALWAKTGIKYRTPIGEEKIAKGVFGIDITLTGLESFLKTLAKSSQSANTFGSFPAELSLLINKTKLGKDQRYEVVVASTQEGKKMVQENVLDLNLQNKQNNLVFESIAQGGGSTSSKSMTGVPAQLKIYSNVTATSTSYFIFTHTVHFGGQDKDGWNGLVVGLLRRSNFLGSLELQSKTMYPFLAALIVLIIIPTTEYVTRKILKQTKQKTHHQDKDENDNQNTTRQIVSFSVATKKCCGRFNNELKLRMHLLLPVFVSIVVSTTCHLLIIIDNVGITLCLPFFLIVSKILLAALLHRSWLETATHHMGARFAKPSTSKFMAVVLLIWIIGSSISIICSYNGILQLKILQVGIEIGMFASLAYVIKGDHHTEAHAIVIAKRNVTPLRLVFVGVVVLGFLFTCLDAFQVSPYFFINDWNGPIYLIPALVSVMALSIAAKLDHPVRSIWPRPHLTIYLIVLTTILVWIVPWIIKTVCTFWHSLDSYNGLAQSMGFDLGFIVNFVWTVCVFLLSLFSRFFIDTGAMPAMGIGVHFGLTLFRSFLTTLLFLAVKPLDLGFYILVLFQCLQKIAIGLGIKNVIYDRYLSRTLWKSDPETYAVKMMQRSIKTNLGIVAPICAKCGMLAIVLVESFQVKSGRKGNDGKAWIPPFTKNLHELERLSMAAGFFVQVAFHLVSNEIIESFLAARISKFKRKISTINSLGFSSNTIISKGKNIANPNANLKKTRSGSGMYDQRGSMAGSYVTTEKRRPSALAMTQDKESSMRRSSLKDGGLGAHSMLNANGFRWKWERHRFEFFYRNRILFVLWTVYLMIQCICYAIEAQECTLTTKSGILKYGCK